MSQKAINAAAPQNLWDSFWKEYLTDESGELDLQKLKNELYDLSMIVEDLKEIYPEITGGRVTSAIATKEEVLEGYRENASSFFGVKDLIDDNGSEEQTIH